MPWLSLLWVTGGGLGDVGSWARGLLHRCGFEGFAESQGADDVDRRSVGLRCVLGMNTEPRSPVSERLGHTDMHVNAWHGGGTTSCQEVVQEPEAGAARM